MGGATSAARGAPVVPLAAVSRAGAAAAVSRAGAAAAVSTGAAATGRFPGVSTGVSEEAVEASRVWGEVAGSPAGRLISGFVASPDAPPATGVTGTAAAPSPRLTVSTATVTKGVAAAAEVFSARAVVGTVGRGPVAVEGAVQSAWEEKKVVPLQPVGTSSPVGRHCAKTSSFCMHTNPSSQHFTFVPGARQRCHPATQTSVAPGLVVFTIVAVAGGVATG